MKIQGLIVSIGLAILISGCDQMAQKQMDNIYNQVIQDSIDQYNIVKSNDNKMDMCVHAGMVKAAMLQAKDDAGYTEWDTIEKNDCEQAGMPR